MPIKIFISYRRDDEQGFAVRLYERLAEKYGKESLFFDIDSIPPGVDFVEYIERQIELCEIVLVVIGRNWLNAVASDGRRRLENPDDFVRVEIQSALKQRKHVVPILVQGTPMPLSKELPRKMQGLSRRHAFFATHVGFSSEVARLMSSIESAFPHIGAHQSPDPKPLHKNEALALPEESTELVETSKAPPVVFEPDIGNNSTDEFLASELAISLAESLADFRRIASPGAEHGSRSITDIGDIDDRTHEEVEENRANAARLGSPTAGRRVTYSPSSKIEAPPGKTIIRSLLYVGGFILVLFSFIILYY